MRVGRSPLKSACSGARKFISSNGQNEHEAIQSYLSVKTKIFERHQNVRGVDTPYPRLTE
eukprot:scaffold77033_cov18-Tisochrysis_lutea.AAC.1